MKIVMKIMIMMISAMRSTNVIISVTIVQMLDCPNKAVDACVDARDSNLKLNTDFINDAQDEDLAVLVECFLNYQSMGGMLKTKFADCATICNMSGDQLKESANIFAGMIGYRSGGCLLGERKHYTIDMLKAAIKATLQ